MGLISRAVRGGNVKAGDGSLNKRVVPFVVLVGLSGIVAQVMLLRELLINFNGNELTIGIVLANWVLGEAVGAFVFGKVADRVKNLWGAVVGLQIGFSGLLILGIYLSRVFKVLIGVPFGEGVGLGIIFLSSLLIIFPISFCHGGLFSSSCKLSGSIPKAYAWETIGTIFGGLALTYLFVPKFNSFQIVFLISVVNLAFSLFFFR